MQVDGENKIASCNCETNNKKDKFMEELFNEYKPIKDNLIQMLNEIQEHYGYVSMDAQKQ